MFTSLPHAHANPFAAFSAGPSGSRRPEDEKPRECPARPYALPEPCMRVLQGPGAALEEARRRLVLADFSAPPPSRSLVLRYR